MDHSVQQPIAPSLGATLGRTIDLAQQVATDELRLLQLDSQDRVSDAMRRGVWIGFGALCLAVAWVVAWAAAVVALEDRFSLEARLAMLAICAIGARSGSGRVRTSQPAGGAVSAAVSREVLEARIVRERRALAEALGDLRERARAEVDPRRRVRAQPAAWLAGALVIGFLLGVRR